MTRDTPTDTTTNDSEDSTAGADGATMGSVDHTHPEQNTTFGSVFGRGPSVAADGGEPAEGRRSSSDCRSDGGEPAADEPETDPGASGASADPHADEVMEDVDHEAPSETGPNATFERGAEHAGAEHVGGADAEPASAHAESVPRTTDEARDE